MELPRLIRISILTNVIQAGGQVYCSPKKSQTGDSWLSFDWIPGNPRRSALIPYRLWVLLAYTRIPGNAFSFWVRKTLRWSRGIPELPDESKAGLFAYLHGDGARAEARERELRERYDLGPLRARSTAANYRKNLYLIDILERATQGLDFPPPAAEKLRAADVGSQDFHYAFGVERWLSRANRAPGATPRALALEGVEVDGHGIYPDFRSRRDWARAYAAQTGNPDVTYRVADFARDPGGPYDVITWFYPFVTAHHLLLWGLPLGLYRPAALVERAFAALKPGGMMAVTAHTEKEHLLFLGRGRAAGFRLLREGPARSLLVDFHADVEDRRFSIWTKPGKPGA